jgi:hypothetical protein
LFNKKSYFDETIFNVISSFNVNLSVEFALLLLLSIVVAVCDELDLFVVEDTKASHRAMNNLSCVDDEPWHE